MNDASRCVMPRDGLFRAMNDALKIRSGLIRIFDIRWTHQVRDLVWVFVEEEQGTSDTTLSPLYYACALSAYRLTVSPPEEVCWRERLLS
jgi:hypothetical protein